VETVYELLLLPNNNESQTFYTNRDRCEVFTDIYHWSPDLAVTGRIQHIGQKVYNLIFKQKVVGTQFSLTFSSLLHSSRRPLLEI
jgi:hypothetical protein